MRSQQETGVRVGGGGQEGPPSLSTRVGGGREAGEATKLWAGGVAWRARGVVPAAACQEASPQPPALVPRFRKVSRAMRVRSCEVETDRQTVRLRVRSGAPARPLTPPVPSPHHSHGYLECRLSPSASKQASRTARPPASPRRAQTRSLSGSARGGWLQGACAQPCLPGLLRKGEGAPPGKRREEVRAPVAPPTLTATTFPPRLAWACAQPASRRGCYG